MPSERAGSLTSLTVNCVSDIVDVTEDIKSDHKVLICKIARNSNK